MTSLKADPLHIHRDKSDWVSVLSLDRRFFHFYVLLLFVLFCTSFRSWLLWRYSRIRKITQYALHTIGRTSFAFGGAFRSYWSHNKSPKPPNPVAARWHFWFDTDRLTILRRSIYTFSFIYGLFFWQSRRLREELITVPHPLFTSILRLVSWIRIFTL